LYANRTQIEQTNGDIRHLLLVILYVFTVFFIPLS